LVLGLRGVTGGYFSRKLEEVLDFLAGTCCPLPPLLPRVEKMPQSGEEKMPESDESSADDQTVTIVVLAVLLDVSLLTNVAVAAGRRICQRGRRLGDRTTGRMMERATEATRERARALRERTAENVRAAEAYVRELFARPADAAAVDDAAGAQNNAPTLPVGDEVVPPAVVDVHPPPPALPPQGTPRDERRPARATRQAPPTPILFHSGLDLIEAVREQDGGDVFTEKSPFRF
jgi:hypothetical protein